MKTRLLLSGLVLLGLAMVGPRLGDRPQPGECPQPGDRPQSGEAAVQSEPARIVVRADQALAPVSPMLFGQNYGPWMNTSGTFVGDYRDAGVTLLRFPAGNWGDENDVFPNNLDDLAMGQAAGLADALGAGVSVQARSWRRGTPEKAAETVRYSNVENDYGFRYWETVPWTAWLPWAGLGLILVVLAVMALRRRRKGRS